jgi:asparagine synthase (glutamine-hydrolysing)
VAAGAQALPGPSQEPDWAWRAGLLVFDDDEKRALYAPDLRARLESCSTRDHLRDAFADLTARDPLNRMLEAEWRGIFPDQVLTFVDRLSMAHSLEVRSAFLDTAVVEFVARLPGHYKIRDGETKHLLKRAARRYFPDEMVRRPKEGFLMPVTQWVQGALEPWVRETLSPERLAIHGLFNQLAVQALVERVYREASDYRDVNKVLALLVFQEWYEMYAS